MKTRGRIVLRFKTNEIKANLKDACEKVLEHFNLPDHRLLCFFDDENPSWFDEIYGSAHCGFHVTIIGSGPGWPHYVEGLFYDSSGEFAYDNVIYINGRTSSTVPGAIITFAHGLQHFMQYGNSWKIWRANTFIYNILREDPATHVKPWDIPYEKDTAQSVETSGDSVLSQAVVKVHAGEQIAAGKDPEKWQFFQNLSYSNPFDLLAETEVWVERYKGELSKIKQKDVDFSRPDWWK